MDTVTVSIFGCFQKSWYPQIIPCLTEFSIINHPFWGTPIFGNTHWVFLKNHQKWMEPPRHSCDLRTPDFRCPRVTDLPCHSDAWQCREGAVPAEQVLKMLKVEKWKIFGRSSLDEHLISSIPCTFYEIFQNHAIDRSNPAQIDMIET